MAGGMTLEGPGLGLVVVSIISLIVSIITVASRVAVRIQIKGFGSDDAFMVLGAVCTPRPT
jgi:hypothetical protein